jgi:1-acyl-sn-glycerol-3-phosphate acyltransferase
MLARFSMWLLNLLGWQVRAEFPNTQKYVVIAAPHTSNWDFPLGILAARAIKLEVNWIGKHTIFRWPFGWFFRALGGTPVDRSQKRDLILQMKDLFDQSRSLVFALAPEGTRSKTDHWKTGFYHIARAAGVPIALAYLDFGKKQVGIGKSFYPTDDIEADFETIRAFYKDKRGKNPENESLIRARVKTL